MNISRGLMHTSFEYEWKCAVLIYSYRMLKNMNKKSAWYKMFWMQEHMV